MPNSKLPGSREYAAIWEDFLASKTGIGIADTGNPTDTGSAGLYFITRKGDTGTTGLLADSTNGVFKLTPTQTAATPTVAGTTCGFVSPKLAWKPNQGPGLSGDLHIAVRLKKTVYTGGEHGLFVGFTDTVNREMPVFDTGGTADRALATNAVGIGWNVSGDTGWVGFAVDGDTLQQVLLAMEPLNVPGSATGTPRAEPTANEYVELEVHVHRGQSDTGGAVTFYVDGLAVGQIDNPLNMTTLLTPCVYLYDTGGASPLSTDWVNVWAPRDTGE